MWDLEITIPGRRLWDPINERFYYPKTQTIRLLHSLVSISKWESHWHVAYLKKRTRTPEQLLDYIKCMTVTQNVDPKIYECLTEENIRDITAYLNDTCTATCVSTGGNEDPAKDVMTSEYIYYLMFEQHIDKSCEKWPLGRLIALLKIYEAKNSNNKDKKMTQEEIMARNARINAENRAKFKSKG